MDHSNRISSEASLGLRAHEHARTNEGGANTEHQHGHTIKDEGRCAAIGGQCASTADAGGAAAFRLDKRTYFDHSEQGSYRVYLRDYGDGLAEIGWSFVSARKPKKAAKGKSNDTKIHAVRAARRARTRIRQLILGANCDHLLTLTYRENQTDFKQASEDLSKFIRKVRRTLPGWAYVAVPEKQKRGAWHWHIAVNGRQDVELLRTCWRSVISDGNIDVQAPKRGKQKKRLAVVRYLSKYVSKTFQEDERELNGHRFRASQGIYIPCEPILVPKDQRGDLRGFALHHLLMHTKKIGHVWTDDQMIAGWACSWS